MGYYAPAWAALACYGFMLITCWALGQKYFPVAYPVGRILFYIGLAVLFYEGSLYLRAFLEKDTSIILLINTLIFAIYLATLYGMERKGFLRSLRSAK